MKILKKIGSIVLDVLIVIVFIVSTLVVVATVTAKRENGQASVMGYTVDSVQTDSMKSAINEGDLILSKLVIDENRNTVAFEKGQIISYYIKAPNGNKMLITHRIHDIYDVDGTRLYVTWGDNREAAPAPDAPITIDDIHSVYVLRIPFLGKFIDFLKTPFGFIITLVVPLLAFIAWQAYKLILLIFKSKQAELDEQAEKLQNAQNTKSELTEEEKNAIIAEYLAKQRAQELEEQKSDESKNEN